MAEPTIVPVPLAPRNETGRPLVELEKAEGGADSRIHDPRRRNPRLGRTLCPNSSLDKGNATSDNGGVPGTTKRSDHLRELRVQVHSPRSL
jgi:hypothetical protein